MRATPRATFLACLALLAAAPLTASAADGAAERGRYLVQIAGCNDCHTPGYLANAGQVDEAQWLTGDTLGWRGPWGTTYATNLRLYMAPLSEQEWLLLARSKTPRPPMPWFNLRAMTDADLAAIYQYIKAAGPAGQPAPDYLPPDQTPPMPFVQIP